MQPVENGDRKRAGKQSLSWHVCETPPCVFQWHSLGNWLSVTTYAMRVAHGAPIKKNRIIFWHGLQWAVSWKEKKLNIIVCDKISPFHPPATYHSAICPEHVTADAWVAGEMFRWAPCGGRREEETCPPPSIKCAWVHSTTTRRQAGASRAICGDGDGEGTACSRPGAKDAAWFTHVLWERREAEIDAGGWRKLWRRDALKRRADPHDIFVSGRICNLTESWSRTPSHSMPGWGTSPSLLSAPPDSDVICVFSLNQRQVTLISGFHTPLPANTPISPFSAVLSLSH